MVSPYSKEPDTFSNSLPSFPSQRALGMTMTYKDYSPKSNEKRFK